MSDCNLLSSLLCSEKMSPAQVETYPKRYLGNQWNLVRSVPSAPPCTHSLQWRCRLGSQCFAKTVSLNDGSLTKSYRTWMDRWADNASNNEPLMSRKFDYPASTFLGTPGNLLDTRRPGTRPSTCRIQGALPVQRSLVRRYHSRMSLAALGM